MQITTNEAIERLILRAESLGESESNLSTLRSLRGFNPTPDVIDFYSSMLSRYQEAK